MCCVGGDQRCGGGVGGVGDGGIWRGGSLRSLGETKLEEDHDVGGHETQHL